MTGEPSHVELGVEDPDKARAFYGELLGWRPSGDSGPGQVGTASLSIGIHGGDPRSIHEVFFAVDDLEVALAEVTRLGGAQTSGINDSGDFGRWAECTDDQGTVFGLHQR